MDLEQIEKLVEIIEKSTLKEITVEEGQPVCIVEAMKLMNEINCDFDCEIEAVLVSNEQKVEYGQPLFRVKKI